MHSRLLYLAAALACLVAAIASTSAWNQVASQNSISVVDGRGRRITLRASPQRIVSLAPATTEILFALGLRGRIVADTAQCNYPPEAQRLSHIGDYRTSIEQVLAQRPDLVVASGSANRSAIGQLERLRIPVFAVDPNDFPGTYEAIRRIGEITGTASAAETLVRAMRARVDRARAGAPSRSVKPRVLIIVQARPLVVAGAHNFMDDIVTLAGGDNIGRAAGDGYPSYSPEAVIARQPEAIFADRDDAGLIASMAGWSGIPAVKNKRIVVIPPDIFVRPGPRLPEALEFATRELRARFPIGVGK